MIERYIAEIRAEASLADHADRLLELVRPHIRITPREARAADAAIGASRLGGEPDLPEGTAWPIVEETAIAFVGQLDLADLSRRDVDGLLPRDGLLAFFCGWVEARSDYGWAVLHAASDNLERRTRPRGDRPEKTMGIDVSADLVLPPPWTRFVSSTAQSRAVYDPRTGETGESPTLLALPQPAHEAYYGIYERWREETGWNQHGLLGYERMMDGAQRQDEVMLLRLDADNELPHDFVEAATLYFLIPADALAVQDFSRCIAHYGATI